MLNNGLALGVDIGGTKVAAGIVDRNGRLLFKTRVPMNVSGTDGEAMACVHEAIRATLANELGGRVSAIGVASPGPIELPSGKILQTPNLPCWRDFPLGEHVRDAYPLPMRIDNDANAAGLAEALWGAGRGFNNVFYATVGTGIGTAVVIDQKVFYGRTRTAPEGGHMTIDYRGEHLCGCGKRGCVESLASGPAIAKRARTRVMSAPVRSLILDYAENDPQRITSHVVERAWRAGDPTATDILRETAEVLAIWLGNIIDLLEPDAIVVGGGVAQLVSEWFPYIAEQLPHWSIIPQAAKTPLLLANYAADAGIVGAAALCFGGLSEATAESY
jgi:glucokinase